MASLQTLTRTVEDEGGLRRTPPPGRQLLRLDGVGSAPLSSRLARSAGPIVSVKTRFDSRSQSLPNAAERGDAGKPERAEWQLQKAALRPYTTASS